MRKTILITILSLPLVFSVCNASADDLSMAFLLVPPGALLARAYTPTLPAKPEAVLTEESKASENNGKEAASPLEFTMQFGKTPFLESFSYKRFPAVSDYGKLSGYEARRDFFRCGAIETGSRGANKAVSAVEGFFSGSPQLMDPQYFVTLSKIYGEPMPEWAW